MSTTIRDSKIDHCLFTGAKADEMRHLFGSALYEALRDEVSQPVAEFSESAKPKVYILPGILGSSLEVRNWFDHDVVWIDTLELMMGGVRRLRYGPDDGVRPRSALKLAYLRMKLRLSRQGIIVEELPFDWRKPTIGEAGRLMAQLRRENNAPVTLVGHSMGGLIARGMAGLDPDGEVIGKVITIATPNLGSYAPVRVFTLDHDLLETFQKLDQFHDARDLAQRYLRHLPGLIEMMPGDGHGPINFFDRSAWPTKSTVPPQKALSEAYTIKNSLPAPDERFVQIISVGEETTVDAVLSGGRIRYRTSTDGDGTVPRKLAEMGQVPRHYTHGSHPWLCNQAYIIDAVRDLVLTGQISDRANFSSVPGLENMPEASPELKIKDDSASFRMSDEAAVLESFGAGAQTIDSGASAQVAVDDMAPSSGEDAIADDSAPARPHGYEIDHMVQAGLAWRQAAPEREQIEKHVSEGMSTLAETPERLAKYESRILEALGAGAFEGQGIARRAVITQFGESLTHIEDILRERIIGDAEEFLSVEFLKRGRFALNPVCRIIQLSGNRGFGSGFLVGGDVVMTNNHVLRTASEASRSAAQFEFERDARNMALDGRVIEFDPDRLYLTDKELDFTLVALKKTMDPPHRNYGILPLMGEEGKIRVSRPVNIIQHPEARRKEVIVRESVLKVFPPARQAFAHYTGDTLPGSSGSPVFNDRWEVVALHHSGVPDTDVQGRILANDGSLWNRVADPQGKTIKWVANEGVRISRIMPVISAAADDPGRPGSHRELLKAVIDAGARASRDGAFYWVADTATTSACLADVPDTTLGDQ